MVPPVQIGVADEEQLCAGHTIDLRVMDGGDRRRCTRLDVDREHPLADVTAHEHLGPPGGHRFEPNRSTTRTTAGSLLSRL